MSSARFDGRDLVLQERAVGTSPLEGDGVGTRVAAPGHRGLLEWAGHIDDLVDHAGAHRGDADHGDTGSWWHPVHLPGLVAELAGTQQFGDEPTCVATDAATLIVAVVRADPDGCVVDFGAALGLQRTAQWQEASRSWYAESELPSTDVLVALLDALVIS